MTLLRQKLIDEIQLRGFSIHTQDSYVRSVTGLARFYHRSPDQIADDEIKAYLLHLLRIKKLAVSSLIVAVSALRFFFGLVLHLWVAEIPSGEEMIDWRGFAIEVRRSCWPFSGSL